ncbi:TonB-dependent receptor domain-containing protein [Silvibacterium acidisoli]|uniref:TonB-dependent receptor domain-containing protein n=1 Tax=Acidobacteriaceae bacterium ZG23-2 TaxID=2883246 RepID=UPI00406C891B
MMLPPMSKQSLHRWTDRPVRRIILAVILLVLLASPSWAQYITGSIKGIVTDTASHRIVGAAVQVTSADTGLNRSLLTNSNGEYNFEQLPIGNYTVEVAHEGFASQKMTLAVSADHVSQWDASMSVGGSSQVVQVTDDAVALDTESHVIGSTMNEKQLENLPSDGRNLFAILSVQAGVDPYTGTGASRSDVNYYNVGANLLTIGGNAWGMASYLEDGVTNFNLLTKTANIQPDIEATQEVVTALNGASARFDEPNVVNVITKSGTNKFHGRLYNYFKNDALDASVKESTSKPELRYNQFGGNIGGPILRDRLFFFFDYSGLRQASQSILKADLPTAAERGGNFTGVATIYDPLTYNAAAKTVQEFPNDTIPANRISPFATRYLQYFPLPTGSPYTGYNFTELKSATTTYDLYHGRLDYQIGRNDSIYGAFSTTSPYDFSPTWQLEDINNTIYTRYSKNAYIEETHIFSPTLVNTARIGYNYSKTEITLTGIGRENYAQEFGLGVLNPSPLQWAPPVVNFSSLSSVGLESAPQGATQNLYQYADEINWVHRRHSIAIGFALERVQFDGLFTSYANGDFSFDGIYTNNHASKPSGGRDFADFLLGYPYHAEGATGATVAYLRQFNFMPYIEDTWRATDKLTLNLGLRYDFFQAPADRYGHSNVYDVATNTTHNGTFHQNYLNLAPRLGFSYAPTPKMTLRGGYGIYYALPLYNNFQFLLLNPPNFYLQSYTYTNTQIVPITDSFSANPAATAQAPYTTALVMPTPYTQEWNLSIQRALSSRITAQAAYLGSVSTHLEARHNPNQASLADPDNPTSLAARRPYSWVGDVLEAANIGRGNFNGMQLQLTGQFHSGAFLNANYQYAKALDILTSEEMTPQNGRDLQADYGLADFNHKHSLKLSGAYPLPWGYGRRWLNHGVVMPVIAGGWNFAGNFSVLSGFPFYVAATNNADIGSYNTERAEQTCSGKLAHPSIAEWYDLSCFSNPATYLLGNERRNNLIGPHQTDENISLSKNFPIGWDVRSGEQFLQFRADAFHVLNHPLWELPTSSTTSASRGAITSFGGARTLQLSLKYAF